MAITFEVHICTIYSILLSTIAKNKLYMSLLHDLLDGKVMVKFDIERLVDDLGGAANVAAVLGLSRTTPYGWIARNYMSSRSLEQIKESFQINLDEYF